MTGAQAAARAEAAERKAAENLRLAQPSQTAHPPGAGASALEHILGDHATMPPDAGLLLDQTWRMHPRLCRYTSETFYDGKLTWADGLERQERSHTGKRRKTNGYEGELAGRGTSRSCPQPQGRWLSAGQGGCPCLAD